MAQPRRGVPGWPTAPVGNKAATGKLGAAALGPGGGAGELNFEGRLGTEPGMRTSCGSFGPQRSQGSDPEQKSSVPKRTGDRVPRGAHCSTQVRTRSPAWIQGPREKWPGLRASMGHPEPSRSSPTSLGFKSVRPAWQPPQKPDGRVPSQERSPPPAGAWGLPAPGSAGPEPEGLWCPRAA